jgi:SpoVK/Ycf46/Vps4 family AAA+-type ATPase
LDAVEEIKEWVQNEEWYAEHCIPWRRGWLLTGAPGTGKTSLIRAVAEDLDMPIFVYDLASLNNEQMREEWSNMLRFVPCIALIEDIDGVFDGRKNVVAGRAMMDVGLTFDCLLNCIDGVEKSDGLFVAITTNRPDMVDSALGNAGSGIATRPGRVDRIISLKAITEEGMRKLAYRILDGNGPIEKTVSEGLANKDSPAQFQERCARVALEAKWAPLKQPQERPATCLLAPTVL